MTLNEQIRQTISAFRDALPADVGALIEQGAGEISALDIDARALRQGDAAPAFTLNDRLGEPRSLASYLKEGPLAVTFYRGGWCPYCNLQLKAYADRLEDIRATGGNLIAITPESPDGIEVLKASSFPDSGKEMIVEAPGFDVLHDVNNDVAREFGLVFELPESHKQVFEALGIDVEQINGDDSYGFPDPATYVLGMDGKITWAYVPNNYRKRAEPELLIEQLRAAAGVV